MTPGHLDSCLAFRALMILAINLCYKDSVSNSIKEEVLPALLLLADIIVLSLLHLPEWLVVLSAFAVLGLYIAVLYSYRKRIENKFTLTVEPATDPSSC